MTHLFPVTPLFRAASRKSELYVFDYDRETSAFFNQHSQWRGRLFFVDASQPEYRWVKGGAGRDYDWLRDDIARSPLFHERVRKSYETGQCYAARHNNIGCDSVVLNLLKERDGLPSLLGADAPGDLGNLFALFHELGHILCDKGFGKGNKSESIADACGTIMFLQRFDAPVPHIENLVVTRAVELVFRDNNGKHFTSPVVTQILADRTTRDFSTLDAVAEAEAYAEKYALPQHQVEHAARAFDGFKNRLPELAQGNTQILHDLAACVIGAREDYTAQWGAVAVKAILDGKVSCDGVKITVPPDEAQRLYMTLERGLLNRRAVAPCP